jgi:hypothetical protein
VEVVEEFAIVILKYLVPLKVMQKRLLPVKGNSLVYLFSNTLTSRKVCLKFVF